MIFGREQTRSGEDDAGLIFSWSGPGRVSFYLTVFVFFSLLLHGAGFYLFQVVYPVPGRVEPENGEMTFLDRSDPVARSILQRSRDRIVYLRPSTLRDVSRQSIEDHDVRFQPSFQSIGPRFLAPWGDTPGLEALFALEDRAVPLPDNRPPPIKLSENLDARGVAPWSIFSDYLAIADAVPSFRAEIAVDPAGRVVEVELGEEFDAAGAGELSFIIESTLRFHEDEGGPDDVEKGWIEVGGATR